MRSTSTVGSSQYPTKWTANGMNWTDVAVHCVQFFNLRTEQILIAHDELDLPNSEIKLKESGGHGGHNGLRNIIDHLQGDRSFKRLRIGIGKPEKDKDIISYVLKKASVEEREKLMSNLINYLDLGEKIIQDGWQKTVMNYHTAKEENNES